jgi:hypothetical protein
MKIWFFLIFITLNLNLYAFANDPTWPEVSFKLEYEKSNVKFRVKLPPGFNKPEKQLKDTPFWIRHIPLPDGSKSLSALSVGLQGDVYQKWKQSKIESDSSRSYSPHDFFDELSKINVGMDQIAYRTFTFKTYPTMETENKIQGALTNYPYSYQILRLIIYGDKLIDMACTYFSTEDNNLHYDDFKLTVCEPFFNSLTLD